MLNFNAAPQEAGKLESETLETVMPCCHKPNMQLHWHTGQQVDWLVLLVIFDHD
jgi:hypothetical protein